jgi:isopentenyl-diphosphate Delta-isomerase
MRSYDGHVRDPDGSASTVDAAREQRLVELVALDGTATGTSTVAAAHAAPGLLHRAYSVVLLDPVGRTLLQRRSATKTRFALRWANACCGHPAPGEDVVTAATRRLEEELGVRGVPLVASGVHTYAASDPASGYYEREFDHVVVGRVAGDLRLEPDPAEVAQTRWVTLGHGFAPEDEYAPWLNGVLSVALARPYRDS